MVDYKFNEGALIQELQDYIDGTYDGHYSKNQFQSTEFIIDCGHGMGFALGNVLKYAQRYGKKDGANRKDLMKILHYALIALHQHDLDNREIDFDGDFSSIDLTDTLTFGNDILTDSITLSEPDISFGSDMYSVANMDYNTTISVDLNDSSMSTVTITGESIDDATPEEWDQVANYAYGKTKK